MNTDGQRTLAEFLPEEDGDPQPGNAEDENKNRDEDPPAWARDLLENVVEQVSKNSDRLSRLEASQGDHDHTPASESETGTSRGYY